MESLEIRILLSLLLSVLIGLERQSYVEQIPDEKKHHHGVIGVRSHAMIGILGIVAGITLASQVALTAFVGISFLTMILLYYTYHSRETGDYGPTSELNMIWCFCMSMLLTSGIVSTQIVISLTAVGLLIMSTKQSIHRFVDSIQWQHIQQLILFGVIALVILPYLPSRSITVSDVPYLQLIFQILDADISKWLKLEIINPFTVWRVVVLITGVEIVAFILQQVLGKKKGWVLASVIGGLISSTSTTISLAAKYRKDHDLSRATAGIMLANAASFVPLLFIILAINAQFVTVALPLFGVLIIGGLVLSYYYLRKPSHAHTSATLQENAISEDIFSLWPAIKFALIFSVVKLVTKVLHLLMGDAGFLIGSGFAGVSGMDAVVINSTQMTLETVTYSLAALSLIAANTVNFAAKTVYIYLQGGKSLALSVGRCLGLLTVLLLVTYTLLN